MGIVYDDCCRHTCLSMTVFTVNGRTMKSRLRTRRLFSLVRSLLLYMALGKYMCVAFLLTYENCIRSSLGSSQITDWDLLYGYLKKPRGDPMG